MRIRFLIGLIILGSTSMAFAQRGAAAGAVQLPWQVPDGSGNQWVVYQQGVLRQQGNMPFFAQAAMLQVNGTAMTSSGNQASLDPKTGELIVQGTAGRNGIPITRRVMVNRNDGWVRYVDTFRNATQQDQAVAVQYMSNFNYQPTGVQFVEDPRGKDRMLGAGISLEIGRSLYQIYAGRGAKTTPTLMSQPNSNQVQATLQFTIPPGKQVSLVHVHGVVSGAEAPTQTIASFKDSKMLADLPLDVRKTILNASPVEAVGDREILRGELLDVVEMRDGDQLKGTLGESAWKLQTSYGALELPSERVVSLINVGAFRPRQLVITSDGEVVGGTLDKSTIAVQLSSGQTVQVPLVQVSRIGYRRRVGEPAEWIFDRPMLQLRGGERLFIAMPGNPIDVLTRFGPLKLPPASIASLRFQAEEHGVHEILLNDGSRFAGLASAGAFELELNGAGGTQQATIPAALIEQLRLNPKDVDRDETAPVLELTSGDEFVGTLTGRHQLDARFDTIALNGPELRSLTRDPQAGLDVQVILWDQTTIGGQLRDPMLACTLASGLSIQVPLALIKSYTNPLPRPSDGTVQRIRQLVDQLSADDWKQREQAESQLVELGPSVVAVLTEMRGAVPPEARQRIESILTAVKVGP